MKEMEWRRRYAPRGYAWRSLRFDFVTLEASYDLADLISYHVDVMIETMECLARQRDMPFAAGDVFTRISVWPKEVGEHLNQLDPLVGRLGIVIEIRFPAPEGYSFDDNPYPPIFAVKGESR